MRAFARICSVFFILVLFAFSSCNVSFDVLKRKYRPGYSLLFSKNNIKSNPLKLQEEIVETPEADSLQSSIVDDDLVASTAGPEIKIHLRESSVFLIPCDTPPKKTVDENWSLYKEKKPSGKGAYKGRSLEPYNIIAIAFLLFGFFVSGIAAYISFLFFLWIFFSVFSMCIVSLTRIKKYPNKYMRICKVLDWLLLAIYFILFAIVMFFFLTL